MDEPAPWHRRARDAFLRFWRTDDPKWSAVRDIGTVLAVVLVLLIGIWAYTGQSFPGDAPMVVVESGSMMHGPDSPCLAGHACASFDAPAWGRLGTIDPGDLVLVKKVRSFDDVETAFGDGKRGGYGGHGDVIVYKKDGGTPVIHRAMLLIQVAPDGCQPGHATNGCTYVIPETCGPGFADFVRPGTDDGWRRYCEGSTEPITLVLERDGIFLELHNYPCPSAQPCPVFSSGFLTKGDNNGGMDQPSPFRGEQPSIGVVACCPVGMHQIIGKARGELPWFGLVKLAIFGNANYRDGSSDPTDRGQIKLFAARAPWDIWASLFVTVGLLFAIPMGAEFVIDRVRGRNDTRRSRRERKKKP